MFVKFDENGNLETFSVADNIDDIVPDNADFEYIDLSVENTQFVVKRNGIIEIDEKKRQEWLLMCAETQNKSTRNRYLDAYRKYQAAINYGEFVRAAGIDAFIVALRNKDWTVLDNVPPALKYFAGECNFEESGLTVPQH